MIISTKTIDEFETAYRKGFTEEFRNYLLAQYSEEPFPYEFTEQDLCTNIRNDILAYEAGDLDVTVKSESERWQEEREYLQKLFIEKAFEARELADYVSQLEHMLQEHGLESPKMATRRVAPF